MREMYPGDHRGILRDKSCGAGRSQQREWRSRWKRIMQTLEHTTIASAGYYQGHTTHHLRISIPRNNVKSKTFGNSDAANLLPPNLEYLARLAFFCVLWATTSAKTNFARLLWGLRNDQRTFFYDYPGEGWPRGAAPAVDKWSLDWWTIER